VLLSESSRGLWLFVSALRIVHFSLSLQSFLLLLDAHAWRRPDRASVADHCTINAPLLVIYHVRMSWGASTAVYQVDKQGWGEALAVRAYLHNRQEQKTLRGKKPLPDTPGLSFGVPGSVSARCRRPESQPLRQKPIAVGCFWAVG
jgi:hypothetical protein